MRIAIDAHAIGRRLTGNEVYVRSLLDAFAAHARDCEILAYVSEARAYASIPDGVQTRRIAANPFLRLGIDLASRVRQDHPDLLHVQYTAPVACSVPIVATVHDVSYLEHPEYFTPGRAAQLRLTVGRTVRRAARIITGTEAVRNSILKVYPGLQNEKIAVIPLAASPDFRPIPREMAAAFVRERFTIGGPFLLAVGDIQPRKNHIGLIQSFTRMATAYPELKQKLVIAGQSTWFSGKVREAARTSGAGDRIQFLGFVTDTDLLHLYNACNCFVFPSFYEGFGLPALEAMACGKAVVCSNAAALAEVVDGAAILFNPHATDEMARAMADLLLQPELRGRMERLGAERAAHFTWKKTAQRTMETYHQVIAQRFPLRQAVVSTVGPQSTY